MKYINSIIIVSLLIVCSFSIEAQVTVGISTPTTDKAALEVSSQVNGTGPYKGMMLPRVPTEVDRDGIPTSSTDNGLLVYVEDTGCLDIYNGTFWEHINCTSSTPPPVVSSTDIWINEIHYSNIGTDVNEFIEIAGVTGINLTGYNLVLYNGATQMEYNTSPLSGIINNDTTTGFGFSSVSYPSNGIQNGNPDGVALVDPSGVVIQFLSYGGTFVAIGGPADGLMSIDIGVEETDTTAIGLSLQLTGTGSEFSDFTWAAPNSESQNLINIGQTIN